MDLLGLLERSLFEWISVGDLVPLDLSPERVCRRHDRPGRDFCLRRVTRFPHLTGGRAPSR